MRRSGIIAALCSTALLASCGGSGRGTAAAGTSSSAAVTKSEYVKRADQACQDAKTKKKALQGQYDAAVTRQGANLVTARLIAIHRLSGIVRQLQAIDRSTTSLLRAIPVPGSDSAVLTDWIRAHEAQAADEGTWAADLSRYTRADVAQGRLAVLNNDLQALKVNAGKETAIAKGYGFTICDIP